jgi:hypothetical protein
MLMPSFLRMTHGISEMEAMFMLSSLPSIKPVKPNPSQVMVLSTRFHVSMELPLMHQLICKKQQPLEIPSLSIGSMPSVMVEVKSEPTSSAINSKDSKLNLILFTLVSRTLSLSSS